MTIISLAVETNLSLNNSVGIYDTPQAAAAQFVKDLVLEEGEVITLILAAAIADKTRLAAEDTEFAHEVERHFEFLAPELFAEGYVWLDE